MAAAKMPEVLFVPSVEQFKHDSWVTYDRDVVENQSERMRLSGLAHAGRSGRLNAKDRKELTFHCGTQCCVVGWAGLAFGEKGCYPGDLRKSTTAEFLNKFIEFAGCTPVVLGNCASNIQFVTRVAERASGVFEGTGVFTNGKSLTPEEAHKLWRKTGDFFGYDTRLEALADKGPGRYCADG